MPPPPPYFVIDDLRRGFSDRDRSKLEKSLRGLLIRVTHRSEVKRKFKITKLTPTPASSTLFMKENTKTDVATYFFQTYGRRLQYPFMPCVVTGRDVFLPMEICTVIEVMPNAQNGKKTHACCSFLG
jgi:eukaryotic translation initiation factor 2C